MNKENLENEYSNTNNLDEINSNNKNFNEDDTRIYTLYTLSSIYIDLLKISEIITSYDFKVSILSTVESSKFDIYYKKNIHKSNYNVLKISIDICNIYKFRDKLHNEDIMKFIIMRYFEKKKVNFKIDTHNPIEIKKYLFESLRIMPRELTKLSSKNQRLLSKIVKRGRYLGVIHNKIK